MVRWYCGQFGTFIASFPDGWEKSWPQIGRIGFHDTNKHDLTVIRECIEETIINFYAMS